MSPCTLVVCRHINREETVHSFLAAETRERARPGGAAAALASMRPREHGPESLTDRHVDIRNDIRNAARGETKGNREEPRIGGASRSRGRLDYKGGRRSRPEWRRKETTASLKGGENKPRAAVSRYVFSLFTVNRQYMSCIATTLHATSFARLAWSRRGQA